MEAIIITLKDLEAFKQDIISSIKELLKSDNVDDQEWVRARDVKKMLSISDNSLKALHIAGKLSRVKVHRTFYFRKSEVQNLFKADCE